MKPLRTPSKRALCKPLGAVALALTAGCAADKPSRPTDWRMEPVLSVTHSQGSAEAYYQMGRYYAGMLRWDRAIDAYGRAIAADPRHLEAHTALAAALAQAQAPRPATIDPPAIREPEPPSLARATTVPTMQVVDRPTIAALQLASASTTLHEAEPVVQILQASGRLELSNGSGITGAAARMRHWLAVQGIATQRLSNQRPYNQQRTVIQYRHGQEASAQRMAALLPAGTETLAVDTLRTDVRVVLGRDWEQVVSCIEQAGCRGPIRVAQADTDGR